MKPPTDMMNRCHRPILLKLFADCRSQTVYQIMPYFHLEELSEFG